MGEPSGQICDGRSDIGGLTAQIVGVVLHQSLKLLLREVALNRSRETLRREALESEGTNGGRAQRVGDL